MITDERLERFLEAVKAERLQRGEERQEEERAEHHAAWAEYTHIDSDE